MELSIDTIPGVVFTVVMLCWIAFAAGFFLRKRHPKAREQKRDSAARYGLLLEAIGYTLVWTFRRPQPSSVVPSGFVLSLAMAIIAIGLSICSTWMVLAAVRTLGKQWSVAARLVEDHTLITTRPYNVVRNPIYAGMFGMMLATGLAVSYWWILPPAIVVFWAGTIMRIRSEEKLLREAFGNDFEQYSQRVPALVPFLR
jgi:protein-S-isoprenylcysteine O-methyltransferase Ste14